MKFTERMIHIVHKARNYSVEDAHDLLWYAYHSGKITSKQLQYAFDVLRTKGLVP